MFERQALYHLRHAPSPFSLYFSDRVLCFCLGPAFDHDPPTHPSYVVGITGRFYHSWLVG
jgi:hypothetical protein